ncbi:hypothetical protein [Nocardia brasiliensis]|uniref:hypothetical protein n=1 Tax=Nocardia brasiliensis TaxID=37326 RepID=UPI00366FDBB5
MEVVEWAAERASDRNLLVHIEPLVERLIHESAGVVGRVAVHRMWVGHEADSSPQRSGTDSQFGVGAEEPFIRAIALDLDPPQTCLDLLLGDRAVAGQIEQPFLLTIELIESLLQAVVHGSDGALLVSEDSVE